MDNSSSENRPKDEIPEVMESLLSEDQMSKDEIHMLRPDKSTKHFRRWFFGIIFVLVTLVFMSFLVLHIYGRTTAHQSKSYFDSNHQNNDTFSIQNVNSNVQESSSNIELIQMDNKNPAVLQDYNNELFEAYLRSKKEKLTEIDEEIIDTDDEFDENESEENYYYYYDDDDVTSLTTDNSISTITIATTFTTITITTTATTVTNTITTTITATAATTAARLPKFPVRLNQYNDHQHRLYELYDPQSPIIVTALFDIGRGKWRRYTRTYEQYMNYAKHLLKLRNCLIIYTDSRGAQFVRQMRNTYNTQIFEMPLHDLPLYRYREEMNDIIRREQENWQFDPKTRYHPEANSADYNIIVNSKAYFLYNATQSSRFEASDRLFAWIDVGYGHGREGIIPDRCYWRPNLPHDRITVIKLTPAHDEISRYTITDLYRVDWVVISGGFIAGNSQIINRFYRFYQKIFMDLLDSGRIDDDQTVLTLLAKHYAILFNLVSGNGDWYAVFRLFPCYNG